MMTIVQKKDGIDRYIYEMVQIVNLTDRYYASERLVAKPNLDIVNELYGYSEPTLFDS